MHSLNSEFLNYFSHSFRMFLYAVFRRTIHFDKGIETVILESSAVAAKHVTYPLVIPAPSSLSKSFPHIVTALGRPQRRRKSVLVMLDPSRCRAEA